MKETDSRGFEHATVNEENCASPQDALSLRKFLHFLNRIGAALNIKLSIDMPNGMFSGTSNPADNTVYIHVNSYLEKSKQKNRRRPQTLFGQKLSPESPSLEEAKANFGIPIDSPEGYTIGWILQRDLYVFPGVLGGVSNTEDYKMLNWILYWSLPHIIYAGRMDGAIDWKDSYRRLGELNCQKIRKGDGRKDIESEMRKYFLNFMTQRITKNSEELEKLTAKTLTRRYDYYKRALELADAEERIKNVTARLAETNLEAEFEKILAMEAVETVRIIGEDTALPKIIISTGRIFQVPDNDLVKSHRYDLGKYEIMIDPASKDLNGIRFMQKRYRGPYEHIHARDGANTCFGTDNTNGLNRDIQQLMIDLDIAALVHVLITFLIKESSTPNQRKTSDWDREEDTDTYSSPEEKIREKNHFIDVYRTQLFARRSNELKAKINKLKDDMAFLQQERVSLHHAAIETWENGKILEQKLDKIGYMAQLGVVELLDGPGVFGIEVTPNELQVYFHSEQSSGETLQKVLGYILRLQPESPPELHFGSLSSTLKHVILSADGADPKLPIFENKSLSDAIQEIARLQLSGEVADILLVAKKIVESGILNPKSGYTPQWGGL
ncbi:MAG: hypothetical protein A3B99_03155 [Candidatus Yanofskybacteria bacterium RIFCSPHIGHO2_02_FULL_44_12b]|uniref:Uncharacterized protein n=2 Tax=Candidatus Yanofskyibacteriota TaxID=1752733 RepID=A0A1F8GPF3_9BACT|nr:MAG: hypothetical protein UW79_C0005G0011 [Candidatus Yanofskybacteria bacterium GW2011_GWA2_44_9]OGN05519.1 MAG: hypothetical protein A2659_02930 [Candidatus Yanofskybacteria bacterium RIFCSPHIGHO2_01_FULL_44_24]OGN15070.1 MAG: hypothetical protein A3B99_03155 [Candidatus Yanofskybacteria bacterium RIFCSPHIGHO2_02_FULL_44_12b]OGN26538.1 MAG: hypothetical protein A2925_03295 [Candidatus Yanofskybacteria bacterium RIFCSPLOWO2_01_FULL_44_22]